MKAVTLISLTGLLFILFAAKSQADNVNIAQIERIDPPNWWVGMHDNKVQLLIYGNGIGNYQLSSAEPKVKLVRADTTENSNYLFATLAIDPSLDSETILLEFEKPGTKPFSQPYKILTRAAQSAERKGFDNSDLIYLITPDRFANGDVSNDHLSHLGDELDRAKEFSRHGGDLKGIGEHLNYLQRIGVTQLWLNPVIENKQPKSSYHGYAVTDHYQIDPRYGSNQSYVALSTKAKKMGIGLIADMVPNHCGNHHWWMDDLPSKDWINFGGEFSPTNHMRETVQDPYALDSDKLQFSDGWFVPTMPDLNQRNPMVSNYLIQNAIWWIETAHLSGLRVDTWSYSDKNFLSQWSERILAEYPKLNMVGEEWSTDPNIIAYWQKGAKNSDGYRSDLPSLFDFPLQTNLIAALQESESWNTGLIKLYKTLAADHLYANAKGLTTFVDNHDMSRVMTQLDDDPELAKMAITLLATLRGVPQVYYGTEIGMSHTGTESHGAIRADFPGGWPHDKVNAFTGKSLNETQQKLLDYFAALFNWRKTAKALHNGSTQHLAPQDGVYSFVRFSNTERWLVVVNKNTKSMPLTKAYLSPLVSGGRSATELFTQKKIALNKGLLAPAKSVSIYRIQ